MSMHFRETGERFRPVYDDGRTKQAFKDECDIARLLERSQVSGTLSHLAKYEPQYGEFRDFDFLQNALALRRGQEIFDSLPSSLRREFNGSPAEYFAYVNDPANRDRLAELLPELARPGMQRIDAARKAAMAATEPPADPPAVMPASGGGDAPSP